MMNISSVIRKDLYEILSRVNDWKFFLGKSVLVTGANGLLASYLVDFFSYINSLVDNDKKIKIYALARNGDKLKSRFPSVLGEEWFIPILQDVSSRIDIVESLNIIIHAASPANQSEYLNHPVPAIRSSLLGMLNILDLALEKNSKILYFSSGAVYGRGGQDKPIAESDFGYQDTLDVFASYVESKRACETLCGSYYRQFGVDVVIARISHTYGPTANLDDGRSFNSFIRAARQGDDIVLTSDGGSSRPFCYISDATVAFLLLLIAGRPGEAYNVGSDRESTILEIAQLIAGLSPHDDVQVQITSQPSSSEIRAHGCFDLGKIKFLGWQPLIQPSDGFKRVFEFLEELK